MFEIFLILYYPDNPQRIKLYGKLSIFNFIKHKAFSNIWKYIKHVLIKLVTTKL